MVIVCLIKTPSKTKKRYTKNSEKLSVKKEYSHEYSVGGKKRFMLCAAEVCDDGKKRRDNRRRRLAATRLIKDPRY